MYMILTKYSKRHGQKGSRFYKAQSVSRHHRPECVGTSAQLCHGALAETKLGIGTCDRGIQVRLPIKLLGIYPGTPHRPSIEGNAHEQGNTGLPWYDESRGAMVGLARLGRPTSGELHS